VDTLDGAGFTPDEEFPQNPEFYRRVLHEWPSALLVVNELGEIIYGNRALQQLGGWEQKVGVGSQILDYLHPDDVDEVAAAFFELASTEPSADSSGAPWASINTRLIASNGHVIPVVVTGASGLGDPEVGGILYDIRPAHEQDILRRGLTGLAQGEPIDTILRLITDMVALPPLRLDAALLEPRGDGTYRIIGATDPTLEAILQDASDPQPWNSDGRTPVRTVVSQFPGGVGEDLFAAGYREFWHVAPEASDDPNTYRLIACSPDNQTPAVGQIDRLSRANELAGVVLLRARADALLEHSATHDRLTQLPNREGFYRQASEAMQSSSSETAALMFIDLDGFKKVNDAHGHAAGDKVLQAVAHRLVSVTRSIDLVGRLGGDEFVILVGAGKGRPADQSRVRVIAARALQELRRAIDIGDGTVSIAASIGAAIASMPAELDDLLASADAAMYEAKGQDGNQFHIAEP